MQFCDILGDEYVASFIDDVVETNLTLMASGLYMPVVWTCAIFAFGLLIGRAGQWPSLATIQCASSGSHNIYKQRITMITEKKFRC